jgi:hypothetical protein
MACWVLMPGNSPRFEPIARIEAKGDALSAIEVVAVGLKGPASSARPSIRRAWYPWSTSIENLRRKGAALDQPLRGATIVGRLSDFSNGVADDRPSREHGPGFRFREGRPASSPDSTTTQKRACGSANRRDKAAGRCIAQARAAERVGSRGSRPGISSTTLAPIIQYRIKLPVTAAFAQL